MKPAKPIIICTGSDRRQLYAAARLKNYAEVYTVYTDGRAEGVPELTNAEGGGIKADMLLLPLPCDNGLFIQSPEGSISCERLTPYLKRGALVTGGRMGREMIEYFNSLGFDTADYFRREELALKNSIPTAEGALSLAMRELDITIHGARVLICGWGRVAKACARLFSAAGARVCIAARRLCDVAEARCVGLEGFEMPLLFARAGGFELIINTVPAPVLSREVICETKKDCLIIDLASSPGGTDFAACAALSRKAIHALSLPGKCAPVTAGEIIAEAALNIYHERSGRNVT